MQIDASRRFVAVSQRNILPEIEPFLISIQMKLLNARIVHLSLSLSLSLCVYIYISLLLVPFTRAIHPLPLYTRLFASLCINLAWLVVGGEFDEARVNWRFRLSSYCCLVSIKFQRNDCSHRLDEFGRSNMGILSVKRETLREREGYYYRGILIVEIRKEIYERFVLNSLVYCKREIFHFLSWKCSYEYLKIQKKKKRKKE